MKKIKDISKESKDKKEQENSLKFHLSFIEQKLAEGDLSSALNKCESALTLINENLKPGSKEYFNKFTAISGLINRKIAELRESYMNKIENLKYRKISTDNLEDTLKSYVIIKNQIAKEKNPSILDDLNQKIDVNLEFIKKSYGLIGIYDILNYENVIESTYSLIWKSKSENLTHFRNFFENMQNDLIKQRINEIGHEVEKISILDLSQKCLIDEYELEKIVKEMVQEEDNMIKVFVENSKVVIFKNKNEIWLDSTSN